MEDIESITGMVFDIQHYAVHDGPGIRTIVFLKGCNMHCPWCENPESIESVPEIMYNPARCIGEYACIDICLEKAIKKNPPVIAVEIDRDLCSRCLDCAQVCTPEAIRTVGRKMTAGAVMEELLSDRVFYREAGGITISGGEPLLQRDFTIALLRLAARHHLSTAVETNGSVDSKTFKEALLYTGYLLLDLKHMDEKTHREFTGIGNEQVLENLRTAVRTIPDVTVRVPVIPGFNMNEKDLLAIAVYAEDVSVKRLHLLPYHTLGASKSEFLGREYPYGNHSFKRNLLQDSSLFADSTSGESRSKQNPRGGTHFSPVNTHEIKSLRVEEVEPYKQLIEERTNLQVTIGG